MIQKSPGAVRTVPVVAEEESADKVTAAAAAGRLQVAGSEGVGCVLVAAVKAEMLRVLAVGAPEQNLGS